ncbi:MAG: hypothetical protein ABI605_13680 [Rhizobacter sp.]
MGEGAPDPFGQFARLKAVWTDRGRRQNIFPAVAASARASRIRRQRALVSEAKDSTPLPSGAAMSPNPEPNLRLPAARLRAALAPAAAALICGLLVACGGGGGGGSPAIAPTITAQPADVALTTGLPTSFTVTAGGTAPLAYQWQRNSVDIAGATAATYSLPATVMGDSGASFRAVVSNVAGSATSDAATLTVTMSPPVLTITPQPASISVLAGAQASFTVGGVCSSGTLAIQWQRNSGSGGAFADLAGATAATYSFIAVLADSAAEFRAVLECSGQSQATSSMAVLTVSGPPAVTLSPATLSGIRAQAPFQYAMAIAQMSDESYVLFGSFRLWRLAADLGSISFLAGDDALPGTTDGLGAAAKFTEVGGITQDAAGNIWIADGPLIRRVTPAGNVTTIAGGASGFMDGTGRAARFNTLRGIAFGTDGDLYIGDTFNNRVRRMTPAGVVTTYTSGFNSLNAIAVAPNNDVYVAEGTHRIRRIVRNGTVAGAVQLVAGDGSFAIPNPADGPGATAQIPGPQAMVLRGTTLYVRDYAGLIRTVDTVTGVVGTLTGSRTLGEGYADGTSAQARLASNPARMTNGRNGGFLIADGPALRTVDAAGTVRTIAYGSPSSTTSIAGGSEATGVLAQQPFDFLGRGGTALAVDAQGRIVVSESNESTVRRIDTNGNVTLVAGLVRAGGSVDGVGSTAQLRGTGSALTIAPNGDIFVSDQASVKRIDTSDLAIAYAGSTDILGSGAVDGPPATARFGSVAGLAVAAHGVVIVADYSNAALRSIDAAGNVTTFSGVMGQRGTVDGPAGTARYDAPGELRSAPDGTLVLNDNGKLRRIAEDGSVTTTSVSDVLSFVVDPAGAIYVLKFDGLYSVSSTGTTTLLVPLGSDLVLGNGAPTLGTTGGAMAMLGPKQIVLVASRKLVTVTLP